MAERRLALGGILAPIVFIGALAVFSQLTPNYDNFMNAVSELGVLGAPYALGWNLLGFILVGCLVTAFAWSLYLSLRTGSGTRMISILVGITGVAFASLGIFPAEMSFRPSTSTTLHFVAVAVSYVPFILVAFIYAATMRLDPYWRRWTIFSIAMGTLGLASFFVPQTVPVGLSQRLGLGVYFLWLFVMGLAVLKKPQST